MVSLAVSANDIQKGPYSMCPTVSSVKVLWQDASPTTVSEGVLAYGTDSAHLSDTIRSWEGWNVPKEGFVHIVQLTHLQPFTRYYYKVLSGNNATGSTKTAPLPGTAFRIFSLSDIHGNSCHNWSNMQNDICALEPDLCIFNGDFVSDNGADRLWNGYFFDPGKQFLAQVPMMSSIGNHETGVPRRYRWSHFYDYFHQFSHGSSTDKYKDPRGEAYFTWVYGPIRFIMLNLNEDASSPNIKTTDQPQYRWCDSVLMAATEPWIIVCHHVGMWTSGYHGQWSDYQKQFSGVLTKYAQEGKHIISLSGDDHSFEHIYKDGVHYVRPGCGRNSNYVQQQQLIDAQYSLFYMQRSCYSTLDVSADAATIHLTARDSVGNVFYEYDFKQP